MYSPTTNPGRLLVDIRFLEHGREGDEVKLTYEPPDEHDHALVSPPSTPTAAAPSPSGPGTTAPADAAARPAALPPGSELRGLTTIRTVVDELTPQAAACGLDQAKIKTSIASILSDAGFKTQPYGNEESYVLLTVVTSKLPDGVCVSRYDASLIAQADATFPYLKGLVSVPVQLLHDGGVGRSGGRPRFGRHGRPGQVGHQLRLSDSRCQQVARGIDVPRDVLSAPIFSVTRLPDHHT